MRAVPAIALLWIALLGPASAQAGVLFFANDPSGFAAATASLDFLGLEDWSSAGNASVGAVAEPLQPGIANGIFPHGTNPATGITVQSNTLGGSGSAPSPGAGLFFAPAGFAGVSGTLQASNQLSTVTNNTSFDVLFANVGDSAPTAVSLSPMFYRTTGASNAGGILVRVYDETNGLLGSTTVPNVFDSSEAAFLGIVTTDGDALGRVNLWAGTVAVPGADNLRVYAVPEPATFGTAVAVAALASLWRRAFSAGRTVRATPASRTRRAG